MFELSMSHSEVLNAITTTKTTKKEKALKEFSAAIANFKTVEKKNMERDSFMCKFFGVDLYDIDEAIGFRVVVLDYMHEIRDIKSEVVRKLYDESISVDTFVKISAYIKKCEMIDFLIGMAKKIIKEKEVSVSSIELACIGLNEEETEMFLEMIKRVQKATIKKLTEALEISKEKKVKATRKEILNSLKAEKEEEIEEESTEEIEEESTEEIEEVQAPKGRREKTTV